MSSHHKCRLGVNIDHIATLREVRGVSYPDPSQALPILRECGVEQVTLHLREDRRHIQDCDLKKIIEMKLLPVNMELAFSQDVLKRALQLKPATVTFVPEKRQELTTEGGLDLVRRQKKIGTTLRKIKNKNIRISFFIEPDVKQVEVSQILEADAIEIHTGKFAHLIESYFQKNKNYDWSGNKIIEKEWRRIAEAAVVAHQKGLEVCAGHGLHTMNLPGLVRIPEIIEYNIGHAIVSRAVWVGLKEAVLEIQRILNPL